MLTWIETKLQAILTAYKVNNTTALEKVGVLNINALEKKFSAYLEKEQILLTYRELPGTLPKMPVYDKITNANMYVYAVESEKVAVECIMNEFISTYNATEQTTISKILNFTNLTPLGDADNSGAIDYQAWQFGLMATIIDSLTTIHDRFVTITTTDNVWAVADKAYWEAYGESSSDYDVAGGDPTGVASTYLPTATHIPVDTAARVTDYSLNVAYYKITTTVFSQLKVANGLVAYQFEKAMKYAEYPTSTTENGKTPIYYVPRVTIGVIDNDNAYVTALKDLVYSDTMDSKTVYVHSGDSYTWFDGYLISAIDAITENGFPLLNIVLERG